MKNKQKDTHGGNLEKILKQLNLPLSSKIKYDFSVNLNPLGYPDILDKAFYSKSDSLINDYPEIFANCAEKAIAEYEKVKKENIIVANGATEAFDLIFHAIKPKKILIPTPTYSGYYEAAKKYESKIFYQDNFYFDEDFYGLLNTILTEKIDIVFIGNPNNPTGKVLQKKKILELTQKTNCYFIIDESFIDFTNKENSCLLETPSDKIIVVKSLTKFYSIAGLRAGFAFSSKRTIDKLRKSTINWSVNGFAQLAIQHLFDTTFIKDSIDEMQGLKEAFYNDLSQISYLKIYDTDANFILCKLIRTNETATSLQKKLIQRGFLIRSCKDVKGLDDSFFRLAIKQKSINDKLICTLRNIFNLPNDTSASCANKKRAKAIMIVGTASNSGKSVIAAGFCRLLKNKGYTVAPFKAQNMSLNSFVTKESGEMGRAQVTQAKAAGIEPHTDMNPVLLKPLGDSTSQVIVNGKAIGNYSAVDYYKEKNTIQEYAFDAYDRLAEQYDYIVLEGAGSPTEINLLDDDFVNMRMAEYTNAKTILVADIDRGGVFASIFGTIKLLPLKWRNLFSGIIINKFRGDPSLLNSGINDIEKLTNVPVLGIMPFIDNINIEEEDSLGLEHRPQSIENTNKISIAIIRLPRMSNWTDFMVFENSDNCVVSYISNPRKLGTPDLVIIPGTKNVIQDMKFIRESGFEIKLNKLRSVQTTIIGICGGYQILGKKIKDPYGVEGNVEEIDALGFLPIETTLESEKELAQVAGKTNKFYPFAQIATPFVGYEIHCGKTINTESNCLIINKKQGENVKETVGTVSNDNNIFGSYIHGIFDSKEMIKELMSFLAKKSNKKQNDNNQTTQEDPYDKVANLLSQNCNLSKLIN